MSKDIELKIIELNFDDIVNYKKENYRIEDIKRELFIDINNKKLSDLFQIAYENAEDKAKANEKMMLYINRSSINTKQSISLKNIDILLCFLTDLAYEKYFENHVEFESLIKKLILKTTFYFKSMGLVKLQDLFPIETYTDSFGTWQLDRLAGHMKIFAKMEIEKENQIFNSWNLDETSAINFEISKGIPAEYAQKTVNSNMSLKDFLNNSLETNDTNVIKTLLSLFITSVKDLKTLSDDGWRIIENRMPALSIVLRREVEKLLDYEQNSMDKRTRGEHLNDWHKLKLFLNYSSDIYAYEELGLLDKNALEVGFEEQRNEEEFCVGSVMNEIIMPFNVYTIRQKYSNVLNKSHGIILHGPPGTGKTRLSEILIKKAGLTPLCIISSSELNRSKVGETEQLLLSIFQRANHCPYLLCCVVIDEVDALAPKRTVAAVSYKIDVLSLLLSLVGGIKDVPNVLLICSTNRINSIDEAFLRRLQDKFYIPRLNNNQRINLIKSISNEKYKLPMHIKEIFNDVDFLNFLSKMTTNFSGAALSSLREKILVYFYFQSQISNFNVISFTKNNLLDLAIRVADDYHIKLGKYSIPRLLQRNDASLNFTQNWNEIRNVLENLSGRILIDLESMLMEFEIYHENNLIEMKLEDTHYSMELIPYILDFSTTFNVDNIQLIDNDKIISESAFSESEISELVYDSLDEFNRYDNGMIIFDVDCLVGISENSLECNRIQNQKLWQNILHSFKNSYSKFRDLKFQKWNILISGSEFLIKQFKSATKFPLTQMEKKIETDRETEMKNPKKCVNCNLFYFENDNRIDSCCFHSGYLLFANDPQKRTSKEEIKKLFILTNDGKQFLDLINMYFYECCLMPFNGGVINGCQKDFHKDKQFVKFND